MSLFNLLTRNEPIAGLEVRDDVLRLSLIQLVEKKKGRLEPVIRILIEQPLEEGTVGNGLLLNKGNFVKALKTLLKESRAGVRYVILSLPANAVYSKVFSFPHVVQNEKLEEAMKLATDFQLPYKKDEIYCDWEKITSSELSTQQDVLLAAIHKSVVDAYMKAFQAAELNVVAVEFHPLSISRVIDTQKKGVCLIVSPGKTSSEISLIKNNALYFHRVIPHSFVSRRLLGEEVRKVADFFACETGLKVDKSLMLSDISVKAPLDLDSLDKKERAKWFVSLGAALRGLFSRADDAFISLMPVGTEEAYECQKAVSFSGFLLGLTISLSLFFFVAFAGVWGLMTTLQKNVSGNVNNLTALPDQSDWLQLETRAKELNSVVGTTGSIARMMPEWSVVLEDIQSRMTEGINVSEFSLPSGGIITIKGIAKSRTQLNEFKKTLEGSNFLKGVTLPLANLEQKENIPFSIHGKIKETNSLFRE